MQVYPSHILFQEKGLYLGYTWYILSESAISKPGLHLVYTRFMPAHLKSWDPACSISVNGMQRHTGFGLQGRLMFITARAVPTGHRSARAGWPGATAVAAAEAWLLSITSSSSSWHHQEQELLLFASGRRPGSRRLAASGGGAVIAGAACDCVVALLAVTVPLDSTIAGVVAAAVVPPFAVVVSVAADVGVGVSVGGDAAPAARGGGGGGLLLAPSTHNSFDVIAGLCFVEAKQVISIPAIFYLSWLSDLQSSL